MRMTSSSALLGTVLAVSMFGAGIVTERLTNVYITNFPLDEQGNLRIRVAERTVQRYNDSVRIDVFGWATRQPYAETREWGIMVSEGIPADLAFVFSPKQNSVNVTSVVMVMYATQNIGNCRININGIDVSVGSLSFHNDLPTAKRIQFDPTIIQINIGINTMCISSTGSGYSSVYQVSFFIEYEYQA